MEWIKYEEWKSFKDWEKYMEYLPILLQNGDISLETYIKLIKDYGNIQFRREKSRG